MFISHYSKEALLSNIKAAENRLQDLKKELVYWEKKDDPNWKPEKPLVEDELESAKQITI